MTDSWEDFTLQAAAAVAVDGRAISITGGRMWSSPRTAVAMPLAAAPLVVGYPSVYAETLRRV